MTRSSDFSPEAANRAIDFVACLKHPKGRWRGVPFQLANWQRRDWEQVFGTVIPNPDRHSRRKTLRRYKRWFKAEGKKNGKTEEAAAAAGVLLYADDEYGAEVYSGAASRDQATLTYSTLKSMAYQVPALRKMSKFYDSTKRIYVPSTESTFQALSADADYSDGINPSGVVVDELHRHKNRELYDLLKQGSGTREQPLLIVITTAGFDKTSVCYEEWEYARKVRDGILEDPTMYVSLYETPQDLTFEQIAADESLWTLANPALGDFLDIEDLRMLVNEAREKPALRNSVMRLRFNMWTASETPWLLMEHWEQCGGLIDEAKWKGREAYGGLDLASTSDFAAWALILPWRKSEGYDFLCRFFLPEAALERRRDMRDQLMAWKNAGLLHVTPGDLIDYDYIKAQMRRDAKHYRLREVGFDPWNAADIAAKMSEEGLPMVEVRPIFSVMSTPSKKFETLVAEHKLNHGGNSILRWMAANVVREENADGSIRPSKKKSSEKIDGIVAGITGLERALVATPQPQVAFIAFD